MKTLEDDDEYTNNSLPDDMEDDEEERFHEKVRDIVEKNLIIEDDISVNEDMTESVENDIEMKLLEKQLMKKDLLI